MRHYSGLKTLQFANEPREQSAAFTVYLSNKTQIENIFSHRVIVLIKHDSMLDVSKRERMLTIVSISGT